MVRLNNRMQAIYIASPYAVGDQCMNVRRSLMAADDLLARGFFPYIPLLNHFWDFVTPHTPDQWLRLDTFWQDRCDATLRLPGLSKGADAECEHALSSGQHVYYQMDRIGHESTV
jgi:hypothetical protein